MERSKEKQEQNHQATTDKESKKTKETKPTRLAPTKSQGKPDPPARKAPKIEPSCWIVHH